ncbi:MAG: hypothetical protein HYV60_06120 [Planctomycetia bacterium]|nr:hypothetical protein [Planctomycetia bacterium]
MRCRSRLIGRHLAIPWLGALVTAALVLDLAWSQSPTRSGSIRVAQAPSTGPIFAPAQRPPADSDGSASASAEARFLPNAQSTDDSTSEEITPLGQEGIQDYTVPLRGPSDGIVLESEDGLISLVARNASLQDVLTALAETQGLNLITQESVTAQLNTTMHRVPFDDALDVILSTNGYTWVRNRNVIQVTSVTSGLKLAPETQGRMVEVFQLNFVSATDVNSVVLTMLSPVGSAQIIESSPTDNRKTQELLIVQDLPGYLDNIRAYVRTHDIPPRQVLIEAYILKVELSDDMRHGVNFDHVFNMSNNLLQIESLGFANANTTQGFLVNLNGGNLVSVVEMLESTNDAKTLASPKIRVLNGQTARIQVGEQLGYHVTTTTQTSTQQSVQFLDVGVVLTVTPRVSSDGTVIMNVQPEVSSGQVNPNTGLPEERTTELQTDVMFRDNQAYVIGGLIQETDTDAQTKLPWLGSLKHIGFFFKRSEVAKRRSEIIVALLPRVMPFDPATESNLAIETERAITPLLYGPLLENPRPWEAQLPGAYTNPHMQRLPPTWDYLSLQDNYDCDLAPVLQRVEPAGHAVQLVPTPASLAPSEQHSSSRRPAVDRPIGSFRISRLPTTNEVRPASGQLGPVPPNAMLR